MVLITPRRVIAVAQLMDSAGCAVNLFYCFTMCRQGSQAGVMGSILCRSFVWLRQRMLDRVIEKMALLNLQQMEGINKSKSLLTL